MVEEEQQICHGQNSNLSLDLGGPKIVRTVTSLGLALPSQLHTIFYFVFQSLLLQLKRI